VITTSENCENLYKVCRNTSALTQEQAAELLGVAPRTLSEYESGRAKVPDDIVDTMSEIYKAPLLAWWHLKNTSVLGKYLPEVIMPQTYGDMTAQLCSAEWRLKQVVEEIQRIMENGTVEEHEQPDFESALEYVKQVNAKLMSVIIYAGGKK
jgi:transcriptional regulator with XRE-family HTH domain